VEERLQELNRKFRARIGQGTVALTQTNGGLVRGKFPDRMGNAQITANIGELAASIAHDFNNILSIVEAYAALIVSNPRKPKEVIEHAKVIRETVEKGAVLAGQLLALERKTETELESALREHINAREFLWVQEEPANMGALSFVVPEIERLTRGQALRSVKRSGSSTPATGSHTAHEMEQKTLLGLAFAAF